MPYLRVYAVIMASLIALFAGVILHGKLVGRASRGKIEAALQGMSPLLMSPDPGLNNSARYIRHLVLSYPGAAFPDFPAQQDYLPAGMVWAPPGFPGVRTAFEVEGER